MARKKILRTGWRLSRQITNLVAFGLFAMVISVSVATSIIINQSLTNDFIRSGKNVAVVLAEQAAISVLVGSPAGAAQAIDITRSFPSISQVAIYELDGSLLAQSGHEVDWSKANQTWMFQLDSAMLEVDGKNHWQFISPVFADSAEPELEDQEASRSQKKVTGLVRIRTAKNRLFDARNDIIIGNFAVLFSFALVLVLLLNRLGKNLAKPLEEFVKTMASGSSGEAQNVRIDLAGSSEMEQLSNAFNQMMETLEDREAELASTRDKALEAAHLKSEFAANVSHEIRTPLNGIVGTLSLLNDSSLDSKQKEYVSLAESASDALLVMINDILDFSRLSLDDSTLARTEFDLRLLLEELVSLHARSKDAKNIDLLLFYETSLPYIVESDPNKIRQLLNNLINNAAKFTDQGSIVVKVEKQTDAAGKLWIRISVTDTGIGIDEKDLRTIFLPYSQSDGSMSRKYSGTGLGLAISEKLVELLHGDIGVSSERGVGSEFFVRIPFSYRDASKLNKSVAVLPSGHRLWLYSGSNQILDAATNMCQHQQLAFNEYNNLALLMAKLLNTKNIEVNSLTVILCYLSVAEDNAETWRKIELLALQRQVKIIVVSRAIGNFFDEEKDVDIIRPPLRLAALIQAINRSCLLDNNSHVEKNNALPNSLHQQIEGRRILLVEDNPINQRVALAMLTKMGCEVLVAENGVEALKLTETEQFDLIFMDCQMPVMNGYDAVRAIRKLERPKSDTPIVAMTANVGVQEQIHCFEAGMNDFLAKPIKLPVLIALVSKWLAE